MQNCMTLFNGYCFHRILTLSEPVVLGAYFAATGRIARAP